MVFSEQTVSESATEAVLFVRFKCNERDGTRLDIQVIKRPTYDVIHLTSSVGLLFWPTT